MLIFIILKGDTSHWAIKDQKRCTGRPLRFSFPPNWAERKIQLIFAIKLSKEGEYLIIAGMTKVIEAVYVEEPLGLGVGIYGIYDFGDFDPWCLTAILNSKYLSHYFLIKFKDKHLAGGYLAINKSTIENFPITKINPLTQSVISNISKKIHQLTALDKDTTTLEQQIDNLVYRLYNITYDEVKVIDPEFGLSREEYEGIVLE